MKHFLKWLDDLPDWSQSRKFLIMMVTFFTLTLLAFVGTMLQWIVGADTSLFDTAMNYVFGGGSLGVGAQGMVDTVAARNGTYRAPVTHDVPPPPPAFMLPGPEQQIDYTRHQSPSTPSSGRVPPSTFLGGK